MERQILYDKTRWRGANRIWNIPNVAPSTYGERYAPARFAVESCTAIQHAVLMLLYQVATNDVDNLFEGLVDTYKLALLTTKDTQTACENSVGNTKQSPVNRQYQNNQLGQHSNKPIMRTSIYQMSKDQSYGSPKVNDFKRGWGYNRQSDKSDDEPQNQDGGGGDCI
ncbi:MAG: hypothetical protein EZS28_020253 [Streblomastix strix]|uniref:Uncharacterized protein n=1 Tax=Streblomastix strix TaxID=222440 RepID=A0A5J4VPL6_9EUKA|nr:MAG: hypothetical protein EZS28_020253 [Streblomastix strix]